MDIPRMRKDVRLFFKYALLSALLGSALGAVAYIFCQLLFGQLKGDIVWFIPALLLFGPPAFLLGAPLSIAAMLIVVGPITWPARVLIARYRYVASIILGGVGWLLGKWISLQWLQGGAPSVPYDPDGLAGPIYGALCCGCWALMMPAAGSRQVDFQRER
jgi:integral membrane sensor domain MASE1